MSIAQGFGELAKVASDYINNGMGQQGQYAAVRNARTREDNRKSGKSPNAGTAPAPTVASDAGKTAGTAPNNQAGGTDTVPSKPQFDVSTDRSEVA